ncbi:hypothetical protein O3P69_016649 [Scylla paramamosain]|uniref:G-protein coupled receptors family 2 profile 2 domain-containing protein n=1 Tax=Scylla paramamosain TaxID=85552 RepID=A0AAW0SXV6_SCYPA
MLRRVASSCVMRRKLSVVMLFVTSLLIQEVASDLASTLSLRKCYCNEDQAWDDTKCVNSSTIVPVYNKINFDPVKDEVDQENYGVAVPTSMLQNVTVMPLEKQKCPEGHIHSTLTGDILLLPDGRLLWLSTMSIFTNDVFCIVHFWERGNTYFDAHICLPLPAVPRCCPPNHLLHQDGSCHPHQAQTAQAPPLQLGKHVVDWDDVDGSLVPVTCGQHEFHHQIKLGTEGQLADTQPIASLNWEPDIWVASNPWENQFCVAPQQTETGELQYVAQICFKDHHHYYNHHCNASACVRKCCLDGQVMFGKFCGWANDASQLWQPEQIPGQEINEQWKFVVGEPGCAFHLEEGDMHLLPNGSLYVSPERVPVPPSMYCMDNRIGGTGDPVRFAMICFPPKEFTCFWRDILIKVMVGLSCVFLLATLGVYLSVAELRDHTYGRCLISMVAAMLTAYICHLCGPENAPTKASCYAVAYVRHLTVLAVFFWLNVMCFDMWKILRGSTVQHHSRKVFLGYTLYAWGCPMVVSTITLVLDIVAPDNIILPQYRDGSCWFKGDQAYWAYFSSFILILVVINIGFFIHVAVTLYQKMKQRTKNFETNSSRTNKTTKAKHQMWLFTKLFVVMGVVWITDILSAVSHRRTCTYWVFTDIINALQGVFIFIVAVCNKDNLKKIKDAWQPRVQVMHKTFSTMQGQSSQRTQHTLSIDDTEASRKTSITSLPRKISQASNIFFPSSTKKSANLNPADSSGDTQGGRKGSNVSIKDVIPLSSMQE